MQVITPLSDEQLSIQLSDNLRPVWVLAAHIISARIWWFRVILGEGPEILDAMIPWDEDGEPFRSAAELVVGLERSWVLVAGSLARCTDANLADLFYHKGGDPAQSYSRQWVIWHVVEHDLLHGGELFFALGAHGVPVIDY